MTATSYHTGLDAEAQALEHLQAQGFALLFQRYRNAYGEIDLIVMRGEELRFIEVKARRQLSDGLYALSQRQQQRLWNCAQGFLVEHPLYQHKNLQFDLIAIAGSHLQHEEHIIEGN